jgi:hypothetical protein
MKINTLSPRRQWVLLLPIFIHGMVLLIGGIALSFAGMAAALDPKSELNRLRRAPNAEELSRGERWFSGRIERLAVAPTTDGSRPKTDPWNGCRIGTEHYTSGKNSGWYSTGRSWAYGSAVIGDGEQSVEIALWGLSGSGTSFLLDDEARAKALPEEPPTSSTLRYVRYCYEAGWTYTVDGRIGQNGLLDVAPNRVLARRETRDEMKSRIESDAAWSALAPLAAGASIAWLCIFVGFIRAPFALKNVFLGRVLSPRPISMQRFAAVVGVGLALGGLLYVVAFPHLQVPIAFGVASVLFAALWSWVTGALHVSSEMQTVLAAQKLGDLTTSSGAFVAPDEPFSVVEIFDVGQKSSVGPKLRTLPSHGKLLVEHAESSGENGKARCACDAATADYFAPCEAELLSDEILRTRPYGASYSNGNRHWVRTTTFTNGQPLTIVGRAEAVADPSAPSEDYRAAGTSAFYRGALGARTLVLASTRDALLARAMKDDTTLRFFRGALFSWLSTVSVVFALAVKYKFFSL